MTGPHRIYRLPNSGDIYAILGRFNEVSQNTELVLFRSTDGGQTWVEDSVIASDVATTRVATHYDQGIGDQLLLVHADNFGNVVLYDHLSGLETSDCVGDGLGTVTCDVGTIAPGATVEYTLAVSVDSNAVGVITNQVSVASDTLDPDASNNFGSADTTVVTPPSADLSITIADSIDPVVAGNTAIYTVTVNNAGPDTAQNVVVTETLPAAATVISTTGCGEDPDGTPTCSLGDIVAGGSAQFTVQVLLSASSTGNASTTASVISDTLDPGLNNNSTTEQTSIDDPFVFVHLQGTTSPLNSPHDVKVSPDDKFLFVSDVENDRVVVLDSNTLSFVAEWGNDHQDGTHDIDFDSAGRAYVADTLNDRVTIYAIDASSGRGFLIDQLDDPQLSKIEGVLVHPNGNVYVTGITSQNLVVFDQNGDIVNSSGFAAQGGLLNPHDLEVTSNGDIWLADSDNNRMLLIDPDTLDVITELSGSAYRFDGVRYLDVLPDGTLATADKNTHSIKVIRSDGVLLQTLGTEGIPGNGIDTFDSPEGVEYLNNVLWLADQGNDRVVKYWMYPKGTNPAPFAQPDVASVLTGGNTVIDLLSNDVDDSSLDPVTVVTTDPAKGTLTFNPIDGSVTYLHDGTESGIDSFTYTVLDDTGQQSNEVVVTIAILGPAITSAATANVPENQTIVMDVQAVDDIDSEGAGLTYSLTGNVDDEFFAIDIDTGVITFLDAPNFETPNDANTDGYYQLEVTVMDTNSSTNTQSIVILVDNLNESPVMSSPATIAVFENQTVVVDVDSVDDSDSENDGLSYFLTGTIDDSLFDIDINSGLVTFSTAPDFENPADTGLDNDYNIQVTVVDSGGLIDFQNIVVSVTDDNDSPTISSDAATSVLENQNIAIDIQATDDADSEGSGLTYQLTGTNDDPLFDIDVDAGIVTFLAVPDFELPGDADANNTYLIQITVTDGGGLTDIQNVVITVTDDAPSIVSSPNASVAENQLSAIDVQSTDDDTVPAEASLTYSLSGTVDDFLFDIDQNTGVVSFVAAPDFENPGDAGGDNAYEIQVTVIDGGGLSDSQNIVITVTDLPDNSAPMSISANTFSIPENELGLVDVQSTDDSDAEGSGLS
ncbi:MAG: DUF11 domain-containing protein, partial [Pirellulaceae bacterium]|nr:DUF11 domain-containing protein [Pirellulaceae bacterium]